MANGYWKPEKHPRSTMWNFAGVGKNGEKYWRSRSGRLFKQDANGDWFIYTKSPGEQAAK